MHARFFRVLAPAPPPQELHGRDDERGKDERGADDSFGNAQCVDRCQIHPRPLSQV